MFVGKLNEEDIQEFILNSMLEACECIAGKPEISYENETIIIFYPEIDQKVILTDFFANSKHFTDEANARLFQDWKKYLYGKFGKEYKKAFNENLKQKYKSEMIK